MAEKSDTPNGLKALSILSVLNIFCTIILYYIFQFASALLFSNQIPQTPLTFLSLIFPAIVSIVILIAIKMKNTYLYAIVQFLMVAVIFLLIISQLQNISSHFVQVLLSVSPWIFFAWYWQNLFWFFKENSTTQNPIFEKYSNIFLISWIIAVVVYTENTLIMGQIQTIARKRNAVIYVQNFKDKSYKEWLAYCLSESDKDLCLYLSFYQTSNKGNITLDNCNLITKPEMRATSTP